ncbi:hypothetical protein E9531_17270 [Lampropedia puyangensis]|uniref:Uncharacterized protein n=1 Tax=Lampropedia puyangensis TaxID=1330072 RepID=A0A4S8EQ28_9BURK|nr:hypothetical protein [Lampropedia puyangensis]THT95313.1 hypothetical protein E9531_17270 [Lampropedia puyangensis]
MKIVMKLASICFIVVVLMSVLRSCGEDEMYTAYKCGKVATLMGNDQAATRSAQKLADLWEKNGTERFSSTATRLDQMFTEELPMEGPRRGNTYKKIKALYEGKTCKEYYQ